MFTHAHMHGSDGRPLIKIGCTRKHPIQRATELSAGTGVPGQFDVAYWLAFDDAFDAESIIHERFAAQRVDSQREFFTVDVGEAIRSIRALAKQLASSGKEGGDWIESGGAIQDPRWGPPVETPFADLFASFPDDGSERELTEDEAAKCRELSARLAGSRRV